jgi:hypothetical protein
MDSSGWMTIPAIYGSGHWDCSIVPTFQHCARALMKL